MAKTTILRRWPSKAAVAAAAVERLALQSVDVPDSGTLRGDLHALLHGAADTFARGRGMFVPRLMREAGHHSEITDLLFTVIHTRRQAYRRVLALAIARGELSPTVDQELFIDLLIGPIWTRLLITGDPVTRAYVDSIVDATLTAFDGTRGDDTTTRSVAAGSVAAGPGNDEDRRTGAGLLRDGPSVRSA